MCFCIFLPLRTPTFSLTVADRRLHFADMYGKSRCFSYALFELIVDRFLVGEHVPVCVVEGLYGRLGEEPEGGLVVAHRAHPRHQQQHPQS